MLGWWIDMLGWVEEKIRVREVEVEAFVGDDESVRVIARSLDLLLGAASRVCASVVAPVFITTANISKMANRTSCSSSQKYYGFKLCWVCVEELGKAHFNYNM